MAITGNGTVMTGLGGARGFGETMFPRSDDGSFAVDLSAAFQSGMSLFGTPLDAGSVFVNTNGTISFGAAIGTYPPTSAFTGVTPVIAPFWADVDTRLDGEAPESGAIYLDVNPLADVVTITWDHVGSYRRAATATDTFQLQLFGHGNGTFDMVFRYQSITWTAGMRSADAAALMGVSDGTGNAVVTLPDSGNAAAELTLPGQIGDTGVAGLWAYDSATGAPILLGGSTGTPGIDQLTGTTGNDVLDGLAGNDRLYGLAGNDTLTGGAGNDILRGGAGSDVLDGGAGVDTADYTGSRGSQRIDLMFPSINTNSAAGDSYVSIENVVGGYGADNIRGTTGDNMLAGGHNVDWLFGRAGNDTLIGGIGDDVLLGGRGADVLNGGANRDRAQYSESQGPMVIDLQYPQLNTGEAAGDTYISIEDLAGGNFADSIRGDAGANRLFGRDGNDHLYGRQGNDYLNGGANSDWLDGGAGNDVLRGGTHADTFVFNAGADVVEDFTDNVDRLAFDSVLWGHTTLSVAQVLAHASVHGANTVFDFGGGNTLTLLGFTDIAALANDLVII